MTLVEVARPYVMPGVAARRNRHLSRCLTPSEVYERGLVKYVKDNLYHIGAASVGYDNDRVYWADRPDGGAA